MLLTHWLQQIFPQYRFGNSEARRRVSTRRRRLQGLLNTLGIVQQSERLEDRTLLSTFYVNSSFANLNTGADPDGVGPAKQLGTDSFATIQAAINAASSGDTILISGGTYQESLTITKSVNLFGTSGNSASVLITPQSGAGVTITGLASAVSIANVTIDTVNGDAVKLSVGNGANTLLNLSNVNANSSGADGLNVTATGTAKATVSLSQVSFDFAAGDAIEIASTNGAKVTFAGNVVSGRNAGGDGIHLLADAGGLSFDLDNAGSFANAGDDGIEAVVRNSATPSFQLAISSATGSLANFTGAMDSGVVMSFENYKGYSTTQTTFDFSGVDFSRAGGTAFLLTSTGSVPGSESTFNGVVTDSKFDRAGGHAFAATLSGNNPKSAIRFVETSMSQAGGDAVNISTTNASFFDVDIINGNLTGSKGQNVNIKQDQGSTVDIFIDPTQLDKGFRFSGENGTHLTAHVLDTPLSTSTVRSNYGVQGTLTTGSTMNLVVENSPIDLALIDGINVVASGGSSFTARFINSPVTSSARFGMLLDLDSSVANVSFEQGSVITGTTTAHGVHVQAKNGSVATINFDATSGNVSGAKVNNINLVSDGANSNIVLNFLGVATINNAGRDGVALVASNGGKATVNAKNGLTITGAADNGVSYDLNNGMASLYASNVTIASVNEAVKLTGTNGARGINSLTNVVSISSSNSDAVWMSANNAFMSLGISGTSSTKANLIAPKGNAVEFNGTNSATLVMALDQFLIQNTWEDGIKINLNNSRMATSTITNGTIRSSGQSGAAASGININAINNAIVGTVGVTDFGLAIVGVTIENPTGSNVQDNGLKVVADDGAVVRARVTGSVIQRHSAYGVYASTNPNSTATDSAYIELNFGTTNILDNAVDGVGLLARRGNGTGPNDVPFSSGINFIFGGAGGVGRISGNGSDGIEATAIGDVGTNIAANTTIALAINNADITGNTQLPVRITALNGGLVSIAQTGGSVDTPVGNTTGILIEADGPLSSAVASYNNVLITGNSAGAGIIIRASNGGFATGTFTNMTGSRAITGFGAQAVLFQANTGGTVRGSFTNVQFLNNMTSSSMTNEPVTNILVRAPIQGVVTGAGSSAKVDFTNVLVQNNKSTPVNATHQSAFMVSVTAGGQFESVIRGLTLAGSTVVSGVGAFDVNTIGAGSLVKLDIDGLVANNSGGRGVDITAGSDAQLNVVQLKNVQANNATNEGLNLVVNGGAKLVAPLVISDSSFNQSATGDGVNINIAHIVNTATTLTMTNVTAHQSKLIGVDIAISGPGNRVVTLNNVDADNALGGDGLELTLIGMASNTLDLDILGGSSFNSPNGRGVDILVTGDAASTATIDLNGVSANNAKGFGVNVLMNGGINVQNATFSNVSATGATQRGLNVATADAGTRLQKFTVNSNSVFSNAGLIGVMLNMIPQASPVAIALQNVTANNAGQKGISLNTSGLSGASTVLISNVVANSAATNDALELKLLGLAAGATMGLTFSGASSFNNAGNFGLDIELGGAATSSATVDISGVTATNSFRTGLSLVLTDSITAAVNILNNVNLMNSGGVGLNVQATGNTRLTSLVSSTLNVSGSGSLLANSDGKGVNVNIDEQDIAPTISFTGLTANDTYGDAVSLRLYKINDPDGDTTTVTLNNVSGQRSVVGRGLNLDIFSQKNVDKAIVNITNANFSNAALDAAYIRVTGESSAVGGTATININGLTANNAGNDGFELLLDGKVTATISTLTGLTATGNLQNGLKFTVANAAKLTNVTASGLNLSNNGSSGVGFDGIDVRVFGANSSATFNLSNITINDSGARAIDLDVANGGALTFNVNGGTIDNSTSQGIDINVGLYDEVGSTPVAGGSGTFTGAFTNLTITDSGIPNPILTADNFNMQVFGASSVTNLTLNHVVSTGSDEDGFDIEILGGTANNITVTNGTTGSDNGLSGFDLLVSGAKASLNMTSGANGTNIFNGNDGGPGFRAELINGAQMSNLVVNASASGNAGDGIAILATDQSGVVISNLGLTSSSVSVNGNVGNGLTVDLDTVTGVNSFSLSGMTVTNNIGDQIHVRLANMGSLTSVNFSNVTATGPGVGSGLGDGLEFILDNTTISSSLGLTAIQASNNGGNGFFLQLLNGAVIPASSKIDTSNVRDSLFNNNGGHGIAIEVDAATADLDILNSNAQFSRISSALGNAGSGINIELNNGAIFRSSVARQALSSNSAGLAISTSDGSKFNTNNAGTAASGDTISNNTIMNNSGFGIRAIFLGTIATPAYFDLTIGSRTLASQGNTISGNQAAGIGIDMIQNAVGQIALLDNVITGTAVGTTTGFNGQGVMIRMLGTNNVTPASNTLNQFGTGIGDIANNVTPGLLIARNKIGLTSSNVAAGNAGTGIGFDVQERSFIDGLHILNNTVSNSRNDAGIANEGDGLRFVRRDEVTVNDFFIDENTFSANVDDGIEILAQNANISGSVPLIMNVIIGMDGQRNPNNSGTVVNTDTTARSSIANWLTNLDGNIIRSNGDDGVAFQVNADAGLVVDMQENRIESNAGDGVQLSEVTQSSGDQRRISGIWNQNVIANNSAFGVNSRANINNGVSSLTSLHVSDGFIGAVLDQFGNVSVQGNGLSGALIMGAGYSTWTDLDVLMNGRFSTAIDGHGFDIEGVTRYVAITNSTIRQNFRDGVEIQAGGTGTHGLSTNGFTLDVVLTDNRVVQNAARGLDILNTMNSWLSVYVTGTVDPRNGTVSPPSQYSSNGEEGIYVVQSSDGEQGQSNLSSELLLDGGTVTRFPRLILVVDQTDVSNNGNAVLADTPDNLGSSGVVVRVGTSDGNYGLQGFGSTSQAGGFVSDFYGGVVMQFTSNRLHGNFGDDVFFHSFVSTVSTEGIGGTWSDTEFDPNNTGRGDPLARLDLTWGVLGQVNEFDTLRLLNNVQGQFGTNTEGDLQAGAFYDDADGTFKSRTRQTGASAPNGGPFQNANRRRNATRLALRNYQDFADGENGLRVDTLDPTASGNPNTSPNPFLFAGMGESTFRVQASSGDNMDLITTSNGFEQIYMDDDPRLFGSGDVGDFLIDDINDLTGVGYVAPSRGYGETPWGWNAGHNW